MRCAFKFLAEIAGGTLSGLGSTSEVEIAFFDPEKKEYFPRTFKEPMEIGNMVGNFSRLGDDRHVHVHITVSGPELIAFTGHLKRGVVGTAWNRVRELTTGPPNAATITRFERETAVALQPFNHAGLFDPAAKNMYRYTALPDEG